MTKTPVRKVEPRPEGKDRARAQRGKKAELLLANPLLVEAFDNVEKKLDEGWKGTVEVPSTPETRERAYLMHRLLVQLRTEFEVMVREGKSAATLLDIEEQKRGRSTSPKPGRSGT